MSHQAHEVTDERPNVSYLHQAAFSSLRISWSHSNSGLLLSAFVTRVKTSREVTMTESIRWLYYSTLSRCRLLANLRPWLLGTSRKEQEESKGAAARAQTLLRPLLSHQAAKIPFLDCAHRRVYKWEHRQSLRYFQYLLYRSSGITRHGEWAVQGCRHGSVLRSLRSPLCARGRVLSSLAHCRYPLKHLYRSTMCSLQAV